MSTVARVCVLGPSGRMGKALLDAARDRADLCISSTADQGDDLALAFAACDVYIDFTTPDSTRAAAELAAARGVPAVIGTTGLGADATRAIAALAERAPVIVSANFSLGVNLLLGLARTASRALGPEWDAEVVETHHKLKRDAPSGTALAIARAIAAGRGVDYDSVKRHARDGDIGPRAAGEIGVSSVRGGDIIGEHVAYFFGGAERIELAHRATSRSIFATGALRAAAWLVGKPAGSYTMQSVLGFEP
jgi:4-hydroxy-tetrahydrodipicolinate reductase